MYRESSDSRSDRHGAYSGVVKILVRSRGLASSCQLSICMTEGETPAMNGQWAADATCAIWPTSSASGGV